MTLANRITKLEIKAGMAGRETCYVAREVNGKFLPSKPGKQLTRRFVVMPEVCASSAEWLAKYAPLDALTAGRKPQS